MTGGISKLESVEKKENRMTVALTDLQKGSSEYDPRDFWVIPGTGVKICLNRATNGWKPYYSLEGGEWIRVVIRLSFTNVELKRQFASMQEALDCYNENMT